MTTCTAETTSRAGSERIGSSHIHLQAPDPIPEEHHYIDYSGLVRRVIDAVRDDDPSLPPLAVCISGPPGSGKTAAVWAAAQALRKNCYTTQGATDCSAQDLVVFPVPTVARTFDAVASGICTATIAGSIGLYDEIGKVALHSPESLTPLASLLDDRRMLWSDFLKQPIPASPGFAFIATKQDDEPLPFYVAQRVLTFHAALPPPEIVLEIVRKRFPRAPSMLSEAMREWVSGRRGLSARDACLVMHFAYRRARAGGHFISGANGAMRCIEEAAQAAALTGGGKA